MRKITGDTVKGGLQVDFLVLKDLVFLKVKFYLLIPVNLLS